MCMLVSVNEVIKLVDNLESNKSAGMDSLNGECMKNADVILSVVLSFCFTCMLKHSYSGRKRNLDTSKTKENICG